MKNKILVLALLSGVFGVQTHAQGVRDASQTSNTQNSQTSKTSKTKNTDKTASTSEKQQQTAGALPQAPQQFAAEYQGGLFGYDKKVKGTVSFDDANQRLVFRNEENKEIFGLPYKSLLVVEPTSKAVRPTAATVASAIPAPFGLNLPFAFIRSKNRYLSVQFNDPDSQVQGATSFKVANKDLLQSVVKALGEKAELKQRGDAYYRPRQSDLNQTK